MQSNDDLEWIYDRFYSANPKNVSRFIHEVFDATCNFTKRTIKVNDPVPVLDWLHKKFSQHKFFHNKQLMREYFWNSLRYQRFGAFVWFLGKSVGKIRFKIDIRLLLEVH